MVGGTYAQIIINSMTYFFFENKTAQIRLLRGAYARIFNSIESLKLFGNFFSSTKLNIERYGNVAFV